MKKYKATEKHSWIATGTLINFYPKSGRYYTYTKPKIKVFSHVITTWLKRGWIESIIPEDLYIFEHIKETVLRITKVSPEGFHSRLRNKELIIARHLVCYYATKLTTLTVEEIGFHLYPIRPFDHSNVTSAVNKIHDKIDINDKTIMPYIKKLNILFNL